MPIQRKDDTKYSASDAAVLASRAVDGAFAMTAQMVTRGAVKNISRESVQSLFIKNIRGFMLLNGGTVSRTGSGQPTIITKDAEYDTFFWE